jgi:hypothetical protein
MRLARALGFVLLGACGTEVSTEPQMSDLPDAGSAIPDGRVGTSGDGSVSGDGQPANLAPCEAAVFHSDLAWIQTNVFDVSCTTECHSGTEPGAGMNLTAAYARSQLVNVASTTHTGWVRVMPFEPAASMLMVQIGGEPGPALEGYMPWGMPRLCDEKIGAIRRWIAAGAP